MQYVLLAIAVAMLLFTSARSQTPKANELLKRLLDLPAPAQVETRVRDSATRERSKPDEFYRWVNVPPDDAPIEDLLEYWKGQRYEPNSVSFKKFASPKVAERLLEHFKARPDLLSEYLGAMPTDEQTAASIRDIHTAMSGDPNAPYSATTLRSWLTNNTSDGIPSLSKQVRKIRDKDDYVSNEFQIALRSLAGIDWDAARPHVERLESDASNPHSQILAYWVRYQRAIAANDTSDTDTYRRKLQQVVEDRAARWSRRDLALDALVDGGDWDGRDDWYISLLSDETLLEIQEKGNTGLTTMMNGAASTDEWLERFLKLIKSDNKTIRSAAARNLVNIYSDETEIIEALMPWISNPEWAKESRTNERGKIIDALGDHDIPEAVPALITVLMNEPDHRAAAAKVLGIKKDPRAAPALRSLITQESGEIRQALIEAFVSCGGMPADEQMANVEAYAVMTSTEEGRSALEREGREEYEAEDEDEAEVGAKPKTKPKKQSRIPLEVLLGQVLAHSQEPDEGLAFRVIEREKILRKKNPEVAARLAEFISKWKGGPIYLENLRKLRSDEADIDVLLTLLAERAQIREKLPNEVASLRSSSGFIRGIGACLSESPEEFLSILGTGSAETQVAMLGCARLLRVQLPVGEVAGLLGGSHPLLPLAAERYLETEDSPEARRFVLARYPAKARILGAFMAFVPNPKNADNNSEALSAVFESVNSSAGSVSPMPKIRKFEAQLQSEVIGDKDLLSVFARLPEGEGGQHVVRVYKDRATFTWYEDTARYWSRTLTEKEYKDLHAYIASSKIDTLPPSIANCHHGCPSSEFVMLSRDGGRRTYVQGYQAKDEIAVIDSHLEAFKSKDLKLNYRLAERIKGLEVVLADNKFPVHAFWKKDADFRVLISDVSMAESIASDLDEKTRADTAIDLDDLDDEEAAKQRAARYQLIEKRREEAAGKELSWRTLQNGKIGPAAAEPDGLLLLRTLATMPAHYRSIFFRSRTPSFLTNGDIYANRYPGGIFRGKQEGEAVQVRAGNYDSPVVSGDKNWVVVTKFTDEEQQMLTRVNLRTGKEFPVTAPADESIQAIAFLPAHGRVLVYRGPARAGSLRDPEDAETMETESPGPAAVGARPKVAQYSLLDAATGAVRPVKGEFRPIEDPRYKPLQTSSTAGAAWAAIYDAATKTTTVGLYAESSFSFIPVTQLPDIQLGSSDIWVEENENKIYFVYGGHVLTAPLRQP